MAPHRNPPQPDRLCLYGLTSEVALAGSEETETNPYAIAANFIAYLSCAIGRGPYLPIGDTRHHARLYFLHIGRSGRGRKGDALSLVIRLHEALGALDPSCMPQIHRGGLSTREGLVALMHDGFKQGRQEEAPVEDKRLWVVESEFANVLHQSRREGNTLSAALRDCWDGVSLKPATKTHRLHASHPHLTLSGAISPSELLALMSHRELTNGFANRFLMIWAERSRILPFPKATPEHQVDELARRVLAVLRFAQAHQFQRRDWLRMELSAQAQWAYAQLYRGELHEDSGNARVNALLERRAPILMRLAMVFALSDLSARIEAHHVAAAMAWVRHAVASIRYVFMNADEDSRSADVLELSERLLQFLKSARQATRREINTACFQGHVSKQRIDAALEHLLAAAPPQISMELRLRPSGAPGSPTRVYHWQSSST